MTRESDGKKDNNIVCVISDIENQVPLGPTSKAARERRSRNRASKVGSGAWKPAPNLGGAGYACLKSCFNRTWLDSSCFCMTGMHFFPSNSWARRP